jgi:hypothetical protein
VDQRRCAAQLANLSVRRNQRLQRIRAAQDLHATPSPSDAADKGDAVDMQALADLDDLADTLESWSRSYPLRMFPEPEPADLTWLHETKPGLCDRISASMGRHMAKHMSDAVTTMRTFINARAADNGETP